MEKRSRLSSFKGIERVSRKVSWDDLKVTPDCRKQLKELIQAVQSEQRADPRLDSKSPRPRGISALFSGASGTGKTMAALALSREVKQALYRIDLGQVSSKYIGETEKNLSLIFEEAKKEQAILFFDEADALFGKRTEVKDSQTQYANLETNYLLQWIELFPGLVILAANSAKSLDSALLRRLRIVVEF